MRGGQWTGALTNEKELSGQGWGLGRQDKPAGNGFLNDASDRTIFCLFGDILLPSGNSAESQSIT